MGISKREKEKNESNLKTSLREFEEETSYKSDDMILLSPKMTWEENFYGNDNIQYSHVYYLSILNNFQKKVHIDKDNLEVNDIKWVNGSEIFSYFRDYHYSKKKIIISVLQYLYKYLKSKIKYEIELNSCLFRTSFASSSFWTFFWAFLCTCFFGWFFLGASFFLLL